MDKRPNETTLLHIFRDNEWPSEPTMAYYNPPDILGAAEKSAAWKTVAASAKNMTPKTTEDALYSRCIQTSCTKRGDICV